MGAASFFFLAFLSEVVGTVAGFGSSVFFVPLAGLFFDFHIVLALTSLLHVFSNAAKLLLFGRAVRWKLFLWLGIPGVILVIVGAVLSARLQFRFTELILGIFLVVFSVLLLWRPSIRIAPTPGNALLGGGIAGFLAGLIGTGGALRGLILAAFDLEKNCFVGTSAAIDSGVDFSRMIVYLGNGYLPAEFFWYVPGLLLTAFVGSWIGKLLLSLIEQRTFRRIALLFVLLIGLIIVSRAFLARFA